MGTTQGIPSFELISVSAGFILLSFFQLWFLCRKSTVQTGLHQAPYQSRLYCTHTRNTHIHTLTLTHTHVKHTHTPIRPYARARTHNHTNTHTQSHKHACTHTLARTHTNTRTHTVRLELKRTPTRHKCSITT